MPIEMNLRLHTAFISKGKKLSVQFIKKRTHNKEFEITLIKVCVCVQKSWYCRMLKCTHPKRWGNKGLWRRLPLVLSLQLVTGKSGTRFHVWLQSHIFRIVKCQMPSSYSSWVPQMFQVISISNMLQASPTIGGGITPVK